MKNKNNTNTNNNNLTNNLTAFKTKLNEMIRDFLLVLVRVRQ